MELPNSEKFYDEFLCYVIISNKNVNEWFLLSHFSIWQFLFLATFGICKPVLVIL